MLAAVLAEGVRCVHAGSASLNAGMAGIRSERNVRDALDCDPPDRASCAVLDALPRATRSLYWCWLASSGAGGRPGLLPWPVLVGVGAPTDEGAVEWRRRIAEGEGDDPSPPLPLAPLP